MSEITVAPVAASDLDAVWETETLCFSVPWSKKDFLAGMNSSHLVFLCARADGKTVGYIMMQLIGDEGEIQNLAVHPDYRRNGVASALLKRSLDAADRLDAVVYLEVRSSNAGAIALYEKFGFRVLGVRKRYYSQPTEDALVMGRQPRKA